MYRFGGQVSTRGHSAKVLLQPLMGTGLILGLWVLAFEKLFDLDTLSTIKSISTALTELRGSVMAGLDPDNCVLHLLTRSS